MSSQQSRFGPSLAIKLDDFVFGRAPRPVTCGRGVQLGTGTVIPEINFTLPPMEITESTWPEVRGQYTQMIESVCRRAVELEVPALLVEFETLPPMTVRPEWGAEITRILGDTLRTCHDKHGLKNALRLTPNDHRDHERPALMRRGAYWDGMVKLFNLAADAGADLLAIESTGGKEVSDQALMNADLRSLVFALGVLAPRDMEFLYMKAIAGVPISMEGRTTACAHLSPVGNIAQAVCDCWSNESVESALVPADVRTDHKPGRARRPCRAGKGTAQVQLKRRLTGDGSPYRPCAFGRLPRK